MNYVFNITTPLGTPATAKQLTRLELCRGIIKKTEIQFPPGSAGLLCLHINRAVHQVYPQNPDSYYHGNDQTIEIPDEYLLLEFPYELQAWTWNTSDLYNHLVIVRFDILKLVEMPALTPEDLEALAIARGE